MQGVLAATGLALALAGCGAPSQQDPNAGPGGPAAAIHVGDLRSYLMATPSGAALQTPSVGTDGAVTLAEDAAGSAEPVKRQATLTRYGFKAEAVREWTAVDGSDVEIVLIQFSSPTNAYEYVDSEQSSTAGFSTWPITGLPGAIVFEDSGNSTPGATQMEGIASEGDTAILIFNVQAGTPSPAPVEALVRSQYQALAVPASS